MHLRYNNCNNVHFCAELVHLRPHRNVTEKAELYLLWKGSRRKAKGEGKDGKV